MKTILIIEDEAQIRADLLKILQQYDFKVFSAKDGEEGVQLAKMHLPNLIICDIKMPKLDGYGVITAIREDAEMATIPFIFLSAKSDRSVIRQAMNLGADDYLTKPFTAEDLIAAIFARLKKQSAIAQSYLQKSQRATEKLSRLAYTDVLTNLPNRVLLRHQLQESIAHARQSRQLVGVLCINLDRFRMINSNFGTQMGDLLLQAVAERLQSLRQVDTIARIGADEFIVVATAKTAQAINSLAQQVIELLSDAYLLSEQLITMGISIGVSLYPYHSEQVDRLLTQADTARRWCRYRSKSPYQFYNLSLDAVDTQRRSLEADLRLALSRSEFLLHYQPQVDARTGQIVGLEALIRWQHAKEGLISPNLFIPLAEETDLILPIGEWVLETACRAMKQLQMLVPLKVAINLSARQFRQKNLVKAIATILDRTHFNSQHLVIELTETSVMEDIEQAITTLRRFKELGIGIAVDDFGTGYSSLNYLRRLPIDELKIDRSFIVNVNENKHDAAITQAIIEMAKSLNLKVVAEGVETEAQLSSLQRYGCHLIQGHFYSKADAIEKIQKLVAEERTFQKFVVRNSQSGTRN